jgi:Fe-S-cluster containining protein
MATSRRPEEKSVKFVSVYEKYECLWDSRCKGYKDRETRATAIRKLICEMRELGVEMREEDVKTRIETTRTTYSIYLNCEK